ncbi:site-specific integrase [Flavivirga rizhaonensis]|uniref:site-specific integrase n=1 Tax=Flavivirga rizhaonensis TaxID=2559571 RepID=UPI0026B87CA0|nr:site-specific integrase [Flavivirga rizhaonensis]
MKNANTFSILFWLKLAKTKNGKAPLYARISVNGKRAELSLKRNVVISQWDTKRNRLKGLTTSSKVLNNHLKEVHHKLFEAYGELQNSNTLISSQKIKARFLKQDGSHYAITDIIEYHNEHMKETLRWGTQKNYYTTYKYIFKFLKQKHKTSNIFLSELNYKFIIDFERHLRHQNNMSNNTIMKHIERLRKMVSLAFKMEWIDKDPFVKFEAKYEKKERSFLTQDELLRIENKEFDIHRLQLIKDLFVFSCYTGLSYGDVMNLTNNNLCIGIDGKQWISSYRQKTDIPIKIPLLNKAAAIISKYKGHPKSI